MKEWPMKTFGIASTGAIIAVSAVLSGCAARQRVEAPPARSADASTVLTVSGSVTGYKEGGLEIFLGIPYAKPPKGDLRFAPPAAPEAWAAPRPAVVFGAVCPQEVVDFEPASRMRQDEDCLTLNVWTPAADGKKRAVIFYIHGGAFILGGTANRWYDGTEFAKRGDIVFVSANYRLGALGFLFLDHLDTTLKGTGNLGLLDLIAALKWVKANIEKFGGNPDSVTIMGESAGAIAVTSLLSMPDAKGLFHKAVVQSGVAAMNRDMKTARRVTRRLMTSSGVNDVKGLRALTAGEIISAQHDLMEEAELGSEILFMPVVDGAVIPKNPLDAIAEGSAAGIPILHGTTADEFRFWLYLIPMIRLASPQQLLRRTPALAEKLGAWKEGIAEYYRRAHPGFWRGDGAMEMAGDIIFWRPHLRLAEAHGAHGKNWMYLFRWPSPVKKGLYGSHHGLEIPFVFHNIHLAEAAAFTGPNPPVPLADAMNGAWIEFAKTGIPKVSGAPEWPAYETSKRSTMSFGDKIELLEDPRKKVREMYERAGY
jgi:para-nitrobenzyl esterase